MADILDQLRKMGVFGGQTPSMTQEQQMKAAQFGLQASAAASLAGGLRVLTACTVLGAGGSYLLLRSYVGSTLSVLLGGAAGAHGATRGDAIGEATRSAGSAALASFDAAMQLNEEQLITARAKSACLETARQADALMTRVVRMNRERQWTKRMEDSAKEALEKVGQFDTTYKISETAADTVIYAFAKAKQINLDYQIALRFNKGLAVVKEKALEADSSLMITARMREGFQGVDEKFKVSDTVRANWKAAAAKAHELDQQFRITDKVYKAIKEAEKAYKGSK